MRQFSIILLLFVSIFLLLSFSVLTQTEGNPMLEGEGTLSPFVNQGGRLLPSVLEEARLRKNDVKIDSGDDFIMELAERYLQEYPIELTNEKTYNRYLESLNLLREKREAIPDSVWVYEVVNEMLLTPLSDSIHYLIHNEGWPAEREPVADWLKQMATYQYHIDIPVSNGQKLLKHLKKADFGYLWHKATTTYWKEALLLTIGGLAMLAMFIYLVRRWRKKKKL